MVCFVGRREHFGFIDVVDFERLKDLGFDEVTNTGLGHDRNGHGLLDTDDHFGIAHASHAAIHPNVCRDSFERHDGGCTGVFSNLSLFRIDDVHNDAALQHLGEATLDLVGARLTVLTHSASLWANLAEPEAISHEIFCEAKPRQCQLAGASPVDGPGSCQD